MWIYSACIHFFFRFTEWNSCHKEVAEMQVCFENVQNLIKFRKPLPIFSSLAFRGNHISTHSLWIQNRPFWNCNPHLQKRWMLFFLFFFISNKRKKNFWAHHNFGKVEVKLYRLQILDQRAPGLSHLNFPFLSICKWFCQNQMLNVELGWYSEYKDMWSQMFGLFFNLNKTVQVLYQHCFPDKFFFVQHFAMYRSVVKQNEDNISFFINIAKIYINIT